MSAATDAAVMENRTYAKQLRSEVVRASNERDLLKHQLASMRARLADQLYASSEPILDTEQ